MFVSLVAVVLNQLSFAPLPIPGTPNQVSYSVRDVDVAMGPEQGVVVWTDWREALSTEPWFGPRTGPRAYC